MISQGILPFKIEHTEEQITPRSGLALFAEVIRALDVRRKVEGHFPKPGSNRGYEAWSYIEPVLLMLEGGGRHIEDLREIRDDAALRQLVGIGEMPSLSAYGDWLVRARRNGGREAMEKVDEETAETIYRRTGTSDYTLNVDATVIEAEKEKAAMTYKKIRGYQPILGFLAENGVCLSHEFREGNVPAQAGASVFEALPEDQASAFRQRFLSGEGDQLVREEGSGAHHHSRSRCCGERSYPDGEGLETAAG